MRRPLHVPHPSRRIVTTTRRAVPVHTTVTQQVDEATLTIKKASGIRHPLCVPHPGRLTVVTTRWSCAG